MGADGLVASLRLRGVRIYRRCLAWVLLMSTSVVQMTCGVSPTEWHQAHRADVDARWTAASAPSA